MSAPWLDDGDVRVYHGDCVEVLAALPEASVDAVVTDPPYGLDFMGRAWDTGAVAFDTATWDAALRVLKPGGHLLAFGGTRTFHRLTCAIEDAGFEVRDVLSWLYGSGFPKSLDVSKAIDKRRNDEPAVRVVCRWLRAKIDAHPEQTIRTIAEAFGFHVRMVEHWAARDTDSQPTLPTLEQWDQLRNLLGFGGEMDADVLRLNLRKGEPGEAWAGREVTGRVQEWHNRVNYALTSRDGLRRDIPATPEAAEWAGWGTALKPAWEPIVLARKPLDGTVAGNVLAHGTGALNVDGCRIATDDDLNGGAYSPERRASDSDWVKDGGTIHSYAGRDYVQPEGRWPANVAVDEDAAALIDQEAGERTSGKAAAGGHRRNAPARREGIYGNGRGLWSEAQQAGELYGDTGGPSRFYYTAKASSSERGASNRHPTVKPVSLMRWLIRLVTPPGGLVLDPFAGSGTTGVAARAEGVRCVLIEREDEYLPIIADRLSQLSLLGGAA